MAVEENEIGFHSALEHIVGAMGMSAKEAEAFLKSKLADGSLSLTGDDGLHLTPAQFAERVAALPDAEAVSA
ncbi:MAG: hypothetical protein FWF12_00215 [Betaproteobacteria bacterium]|nr:hypothetical protein [Betaproteobacteria bacterium]